MLPTPQGEALITPFRQVLELLRTATQQQLSFDPAQAQRKFFISMTDISHIEFLPALVNRINVIAPTVQIEVMRITACTGKQLEAGETDLAVGFMPELEAGFYQQRLFTEGFACVVRNGHPRVSARMTTAIFKQERHVAITAAGTGHDLVERELSAKHIERQLALTLPTLPGLGNLLANTDLIATVPERVAQTLVRIANVRALSPPVVLPSFSIKQHWHERYHQDPANRWLRSVVAELFSDSVATEKGC